jgi:hypothetical protein
MLTFSLESFNFRFKNVGCQKAQKAKTNSNSNTKLSTLPVILHRLEYEICCVLLRVGKNERVSEQRAEENI